jgi:hypothetical protein
LPNQTRWKNAGPYIQSCGWRETLVLGGERALPPHCYDDHADTRQHLGCVTSPTRSLLLRSACNFVKYGEYRHDWHEEDDQRQRDVDATGMMKSR